MSFSNCLLEAIARRRQVNPNTTSSEKAAQLQGILDYLLGQGTASVVLVHSLVKQFSESDLPNSEFVAREKASYLQYYLGNTTTAGADTVFWLWNGVSWRNLAKLERLNRLLTIPEVIGQYHYLKKILCYPDSHLGRVAWDISLAVGNSQSLESVSERVYIEYYPIDEFIFKKFWQEAFDKGYLYSYNSRLAMIELLIESGSIKNIAILAVDGSTKRMIRKPEEYLLKLVKQDIITTMPVAFMKGLADDRRYFRGQRYT